MLNYTEQKMLELKKYKAEQLRDFALELSPKSLQAFLKALPSFKGFRPGKDAGIRLIAFFSRMSHWKTQEWDIMSTLWLRWTESHPSLWRALDVEDELTLKQLLADVLENDRTGRPLIYKLVQNAHLYNLSNQILTIWYQFGPFVPDDYVSAILLMAPSQEQLDLYHRIGTMESELARFGEQLAHLGHFLAKVNENAEGITIIESARHSLESQIAEQQVSLQALTTRADAVDDTVNGLASALKQHESGWRDISERISLLQSSTLDPQQFAAVLSMVSARDEQLRRQEQCFLEIQSVTRRLDSVESQFGQFPMANDREVLEQSPWRGACLTPIQSQWEDKYELLEDPDTVVGHVQRNLNRLGITTQHSRKLGLEIVSALASGQMVTFEGSFAELSAEYCAMSLSGDAVYKIKIPVGLNDGDQIESAVETILNILESRTFPVSVIFIGLNRSSLDAFGSSIKELVIKRLTGLRSRDTLSLLLFATVCDGVANIPYGRELFELGPIFHMDSLSWKNKRSISLGIPGLVMNDTWMALTDDPDTSFDLDDTGVPDWVYHKGGVVWRKQLMATFQMYNTLAKGEKTADVFSALSFGWILPMLILTDMTAVREFLTELDADDRIESLLRLRLGMAL